MNNRLSPISSRSAMKRTILLKERGTESEIQCRRHRSSQAKGSVWAACICLDLLHNMRGHLIAMETIGPAVVTRKAMETMGSYHIRKKLLICPAMTSRIHISHPKGWLWGPPIFPNPSWQSVAAMQLKPAWKLTEQAFLGNLSKTLSQNRMLGLDPWVLRRTSILKIDS